MIGRPAKPGETATKVAKPATVRNPNAAKSKPRPGTDKPKD